MKSDDYPTEREAIAVGLALLQDYRATTDSDFDKGMRLLQQRIKDSRGKPIRVQLSRRKGWRMPPNTVKVARKSKWGNPFKVGRDGTAKECVEKYERNIGLLTNAIVQELRGKNLACWCRLCDTHKDGKPFGVKCSDCAPCHTDVLGNIANS